MKKIIDYTIISMEDVNELAKEVYIYINDGWQPIGGVAFTIRGDQAYFAQSMVKYED